MNRKIFIVIIIIVALSIISGSVIWNAKNRQEQNKPSNQAQSSEELEIDTEGWRVYTNEDWGYSIKYPANLYIKHNPKIERLPGEMVTPYDNGKLIISDIENMGIQDVMPNEKIHVVISTHKNEKNQTLEEYVGSVNWRKYSDINVDGYKAIISEPKNIEANEYASINMNIVKGEWIYSIYAETHEKDARKKIYELAKKIIFTFELTN